MTEDKSDRADVNVDIDELVCSMIKKLDYYWSLGESHYQGTKCSLIYKVPQHILVVDKNAYEPVILSIGPYHHDTPALSAMEREKWHCLDYILKLNRQKDLYDYLKVVRELEKKVRSCYSDEIEMECKEFLQMLLLDGCFIIVSLYGTEGVIVPTPEVYRGSNNSHEVNEGTIIAEKEESLGRANNGTGMENQTSYIRHGMGESLVLDVGTSHVDGSDQSMQTESLGQEAHAKYQEPNQFGKWYISFLIHDLLLLENQIPFFVVKRIYEIFSGEGMAAPALTDKIAEFLESMVHYYPKAIQESDRPKDFHHLLHLCHMYLRPSQKLEEDHQYSVRPRYLHRLFHFGQKYFRLSHWMEEKEQNSSFIQQSEYLLAGQQRWRRALQYHEAGVRFTKKEFDKYNPHSLLDVKFVNGELEIPCLSIDENTSCIFRNLIAFEQTCPQFGNDVNAYVIFMSQLISMPEDVTLLVQRGIIVHILRSDKEVSTLFTKLGTDVVFDFNGKHYLKAIYQMMEAHYQSRTKRWMAWLRNNKFSNPWLGLGVLAATIMLFCTVLQTLIAFFSCMKPPTNYPET